MTPFHLPPFPVSLSQTLPRWEATIIARFYSPEILYLRIYNKRPHHLIRIENGNHLNDQVCAVSVPCLVTIPSLPQRIHIAARSELHAGFVSLNLGTGCVQNLRYQYKPLPAWTCLLGPTAHLKCGILLPWPGSGVWIT